MSKWTKCFHVLDVQDEADDERIKWLYAQIRSLNEVDKSLVLLLLDGHSYKEMALLLGISESNVGVKIHRIKELLVKKLKRIGKSWRLKTYKKFGTNKKEKTMYAN